MSITPDLDNLVVVGKYLIPHDDIGWIKDKLTEIMAHGVHKVDMKFPKYMEFILDVDMMWKEELNEKKISGDFNRHIEALKYTKPSNNYHLTVLFSREKIGWLAEAKCIPVLYCWITQIGNTKEFPKKVTIFDVKSSFLEAENLMNRIFVGALEGEIKDPPHPLKPVEEKFHEVLFNTKDERKLTNKITVVLRNAKKEVYIAGWIGIYIIPTLKKLHKNGVKIKIITKTPSTTTKGYKDKTEALNELKSFLKKDDLRFLRTSHFRLLIVDDNFIFDGSMDMDSESLAEREESAMWSNDPYVVATGKLNFMELFKKGKHPKGWK